MIDPNNQDSANSSDLEVTVRHLREQNAKLLELLRAKGIYTDPTPSQNENLTDVNTNSSIQTPDLSTIAFNHSDITSTVTKINATNQINHQLINNHGSIHQQNYMGQTIHGSQSNIMPNFNTVIQGSTQPFIQNNSNTLVQNNTNLIQPVNLVNFNNVGLDSMQSFFNSQNSRSYLSQSSSSITTSTTTTTATTTTTSSISTSNSIVTNTIGKESLPSNTHSILSSVTAESIQNQLVLRPKATSLYPHQELVPVIPKIRPEQFDCINRQYSSSSVSSSGPASNETSNILDGDSNDSKQKHPRPIRPKPSSRANSLKVYHSVIGNENKVSNSSNNVFNSYTSSNSTFTNNLTNSPTVSLFSSSKCSSPVSSTGYLPHSVSMGDHQIDLTVPILHPSSIEMSIPPTNNILLSSSSSSSSPSCSSTTGTTSTQPINQNISINNISSSATTKKPNKKSLKNTKKNSSSSSAINSLSSQNPVPIVPNIGRPLAPAPLNVQRPVTANNPIVKRSSNNKKLTKRQSKTLVQCHSESLLQETSSPSNSFADSISGFLENFNQELLESNILSQANDSVTTAAQHLTTTITTTNLLSDQSSSSIISSNTNLSRPLDNIELHHLVNENIQRQDSYQSATGSVVTFEEFHERIEQENILSNATSNDTHMAQDLNVDSEPISNFMSEEDMRIVEMNFDENAFLKQLDLEDVNLKLNVNSDQNIFNNILTSTDASFNDLSLTQSQLNDITLQMNSSTNSTPAAAPPPPPSALYPGSSLINNNVFTRIVPLGLQQQTSQISNYSIVSNVSCLLPEEGVQLTARHIEPRQIATYESVKYQDILDDLVMVTDQDVLNHAQAAAASDPSIVSTDFTFALIEATNEIIKDSQLETIEAATNALNELQYFFPMEHEQQQEQQQKQEQQQQQQQGEHIQQEQNEHSEEQQQHTIMETRLEKDCEEKSTHIEVQQPLVVLDNLQSEVIAPADLTKTVLDDSIISSAITDLSSLLQLETLSSPQPSVSVPVSSITPNAPPLVVLPVQTPSNEFARNSPIQTGEETMIMTTDSEEISMTTTDLITPSRPTKTLSHSFPMQSTNQEVIEIDYDALLPPEIPVEKQVSSFNNENNSFRSPVSNPSELISNATVETTHMNEATTTASKPTIVFEPILSPSDPVSPVKTLSDEVVVDSGCLDQFDRETSEASYQTVTLEDLLNDNPKDPYDLIEEHIQATMSMDLTRNDNNESTEDTQMSVDSPLRAPTLEQTYNQYLKKYQLKVKREQEISSTKDPEQSMTIPTVKLKLKCIFPKKSHKHKKHKSHSTPPKPTSTSPHSLSTSKESTSKTELMSTESITEVKPFDQVEVERPRLKITIRTKLPPPPPPPPAEPTTVQSEVQNESEHELDLKPEQESQIPTLVIPSNVVQREKSESKKQKKVKKKKSQSNHVNQQSKKKNVSEEQPETEYAGLTRFERPLAQLYRQQPKATLTPDESLPKPEVMSPSPLSIPPTDGNSLETSNVPHSGFLIDEQTPPSSITSVEHRNSPPPLLSTKTKVDKLKSNYSHLFTYDNQQDQQNNNTFITPPPEMDFNPQQQRIHQYGSFYPNSVSPQKKKNLQRKSSVTSSTSSKSLSTTEYALDTEALEPVSPTPISMPSASLMMSKTKLSQNPSSCSSSTSPGISMVPSNYLDPSSNYFDHHVQKSSKDYHSSSKKMSSSSRSSKTNPSQPYPTSRPLSNHSYRTPQDTPVLPPILPPAMSAAPPPLHLDPYAGSYHHFASRTAPPPFFNFPFPHPFLNPHHTSTPSHFHHPSMKYHHQHHSHPPHGYPPHQTTFPYNPHLQRQQQYQNSNYMTSRDHHPFDR